MGQAGNAGGLAAADASCQHQHHDGYYVDLDSAEVADELWANMATPRRWQHSQTRNIDPGKGKGRVKPKT